MHTTMQSAPFVLAVLTDCMAAWLRAKRGSDSLPPTHMTLGLRRGGPFSGDGAARRYGLLRQQNAHETIVLPAGTPIRVNKAQGGKAGVGKLTSPRSIASAATVRIDMVPSAKHRLRINDENIGRESAHLR